MYKYLLLLCYTISFTAISQSKSDFTKEIFVSATDTLPYRMLLPIDYDENKNYPIVLFLHGSGERGNDNELQLKHGANLFLKPEVRKNFPAIVVFPQCKATMSWNNSTYSIEDGKRTFTYPSTVEPNLHIDLLTSLLEDLKTKLAIDHKRIYVGGLSMGGMGTFELVHQNPNTFAAAFAICGGANPKISEKIKNLPWWIFHGEADEVVPPIYSQEMYEALKKEGADVRFTLYPNVNHDSWTKAFAEPELLPWLFSHTK